MRPSQTKRSVVWIEADREEVVGHSTSAVHLDLAMISRARVLGVLETPTWARRLQGGSSRPGAKASGETLRWSWSVLPIPVAMCTPRSRRKG